MQDIERARRFYESVLTTSLTRLADAGVPMFAFPMAADSSGASGSLVHMEGMPSGGNSTIVYFACEDCAVEAGRVDAAGGKVFKPKFSSGPYGFIALAFDTEGNLFGLHSMA